MKIEKTQLIFSMDEKNAPVARAKSGDKVSFITCDCFSDMVQKETDLISEIDWNRINPATGPLFVEGAEPGDVLKVEILEISIGKQGAMIAAPDVGLLGDQITKEQTMIVPIKDEKAYFKDIPLDLTPMIGVIGTAPAGEAVATGTPDDHGGNMDCTQIKAGNTLYLPVNVEGALLAIGDLHAAMGDGEIMGSGVEIAGEVDVRVEVLKDFSYETPMIESDEAWISLASEKTMEDAAKRATANMAEFLQKELGLTLNEAGMLLSAAGELRICQVVDPNVTLRMEFPKKYMK